MKIFASLVSQKIQPIRIRKSAKLPATAAWESPDVFMSAKEAATNDADLATGECNVGVLCGSFSNIIAVDIDVHYKGERGMELISQLTAALPYTPAVKMGAKGLTLFFKYRGENSCTIKFSDELRKELNDKKAHVDILSDKRQSVIPPSMHPDTGQKYSWITPDYLLTQDSLPEISEQQWLDFFSVLKEGVPLKLFGKDGRGAPKGNKNAQREGTEVRKREPGVVHVYKQGSFQDDPLVEDLVKHCLKHIPAKCSYDEWLKVGFAINHSITGDRGAKLFYSWSISAQEESYKDDDIVQKCRDLFYNTSPIQEMQVTFNHLVYEAKKNPEFKVTQEQKDALTIIHRAVQANRYDIGDIDTAVKALARYTVPTDLLDAPIGSQQVHAAFVRQYFDKHIVWSEDGVLLFKDTTRLWENITRTKTPDISAAYNSTASYIKAHPEYIQTFFNADGEFSQFKFNTAKEKLHSYTTVNNVRKLLIENIDCLEKIDNEVLNSDVNLLALPDGTKVDLRTGEVSPITATDYLTNHAVVNIAPEGQYGEAPEILMEAFDTPELREYMQMFCGYVISGDVSLKEVYFFIGESGNNGKTFLLDQLLNILGTSNLAARRNPSTFMDKNTNVDKDSDRRFDGLLTKRLVGISDTSEKHIFSADLYKTLTDAKITYRSLYDKITTAPNHAKFIICCNTLPRLGVMDRATRQRTVCIPFNRLFDPTDPKVQVRAEKVTQGLPGLLRWMVDGRIKMLQAGNVLPKLKEIEKATENNVADQDILGMAIGHCCQNPLTQEPKTNSEIKQCLIQTIRQFEQYRYSTPNLDEICNPRAVGRKLGALQFKQAVAIGPNKERGWYVDLRWPEFKDDLASLLAH